jgi:hypothetical protein
VKVCFPLFAVISPEQAGARAERMSGGATFILGVG